MPAATGPLTTPHRQGEIVPVALSTVKVYKGAAAAIIIGTGYGIPLVPATSTHQFVGVWGETYDNSAGTAGGYLTQVMRRGVWQFDQSGLTAAHIGLRAYFLDDHTITTTAGTTYAGIICAVDAAGKAWVDIEGAVRDVSAVNAQTSFVLTAAVLNTNVSGAAQTFATQTLPANALKVGDRIRLRGELIGTTRTASDTCSLLLKMGSTTIGTLPAAFAHATTNFLTFDLELVIRTIGASGTMVGTGYYAAGTAGATFVALDLASTTIDTTATESFTINGTFSASNTTDQITVNIFDMDIIRA